jgi:hypothetical protein
MKTNRIEAFSDGVMAIIITIMVLELKAPHDPSPTSLVKMWPVFFAYVLSFLIIAIYWVNHHHLVHMLCLFRSHFTRRSQLQAGFRFSSCARRSRGIITTWHSSG